MFYHPLTRKQVNLRKSKQYEWNTEFMKQLTRKRKVALRRGEELETQGGHMLKPETLKKLCAGTITVKDLTEHDFFLDITQKGVDMRIGLDIAALAERGAVNQIIMISGDSDFVPAAKHARRCGIDFVLDPMWANTSSSLSEHVDGLRECVSRPALPAHPDQKLARHPGLWHGLTSADVDRPARTQSSLYERRRCTRVEQGDVDGQDEVAVPVRTETDGFGMADLHADMPCIVPTPAGRPRCGIEQLSGRTLGLVRTGHQSRKRTMTNEPGGVMTVEEKEPSRAERIFAGSVAFTICMAVVFTIVAIFIGWRWSLRGFVGVLLIGIPGEILLELVGEGRMLPRGRGKPGQTRAGRLLVLTLILAAWAVIVLALTALIQPWYGAVGDMAWVMVIGILAILIQGIRDTRKKKS